MLGLDPLARPTKLVGRAVTVRIPHLDSAAVHIAVDTLVPDDVLVVSMSGDYHRACFGGVVGFATMLRQAAGAVIDGAVTDVSELLATNLSIFSRGVSALTTRSLGIEGEVNVPIAMAGAVVEPGDLILGDENGVMVIPIARLEEWGATALDEEAREPHTKERLRAGEALKDISGAGRYAVYLDRPAPATPNG
jgi:4-hydroxy-4-methyl-2-oxoglutarate aldolase